MPHPAKLSPAHTVMVLLIHFSASLVSTLWSVAAETATLQPQELIKCYVTLDMRGSASFKLPVAVALTQLTLSE